MHSDGPGHSGGGAVLAVARLVRTLSTDQGKTSSLASKNIIFVDFIILQLLHQEMSYSILGKARL